jgi:hypothetical protein
VGVEKQIVLRTTKVTNCGRYFFENVVGWKTKALWEISY